MRTKLFLILMMWSHISFAAENKTQLKKELPFVFLNQYYAYDVSANGDVIIGDKKVNLNLSSLFINEGQVSLQSADLIFLNNQKVEIQVLDAQNRALSQQVVDLFQIDQRYDLDLSAKSLESAKQICFKQKNQFSMMTICFPAEPIQIDNPSVKIFVEGIEVGLKGQVILKETKNKIQFLAKYASGSTLEVLTRKRKFLPATVSKNSENGIYEVDFVDLENNKIRWGEQIFFDQESFKIASDNIVQVYQGIYNKDTSKKSYSLTYYTPTYKRPRIINKWTATPLISFSKLDGNTANENFSLTSPANFGVNLNSYRLLPSKYSRMLYADHWVADLSFKSAAMASTANNYTISNSKQNLLGLNLGLTREFADFSWYGLFINFQQDVIANNTASAAGAIDLSTVMNMDLSAKLNYMFLEAGRYTAEALLGYAFILPAKISGQSSSLGSRFFGGADLIYDYKDRLVSFGVTYSQRAQKTSAQSFTEQVFEYRFGYIKSY